jgi:hypothetical protein
MRAAIVGAALRVSSFWIRHISTSTILSAFPRDRANLRARFPAGQLAERSPAIVGAIGLAIAGELISILAAYGTDALAGALADPLHGQSQQNLLSQNIFQLQAAALVKSDLRFALVDFHLFLARNVRYRTVKEVEAPFQGQPRPAQAAVALRQHFHRVPALDTQFPACVLQQLGRTGGAQGGTLLQIFACKINLPGLENLVETKLPQLHFPNTEEHKTNRLDRRNDFIVAQPRALP